MPSSKTLLHEKISISDRFRVELKVTAIFSAEKYPEGVKARFVLVDVVEKKPRLLVDNHEPFGFHMHDELPENKSKRTILEISDFNDALEIFWTRVWEILKDEN